jgi:hypothetical protein
MSDYSCRNAIGRKNARLSEHGLANALDIGGFVTATAVATRVLGNWGLTQRDIKARELAAAKAAEEKAAAARAAAAAAEAAKAKDGQKPEEQQRSTVAVPSIGLRLPTASASMGSGGFGFAPSKLGGAVDKKADTAALPVAPVKPEPPPSKEQRFLRAAHASACKYFGTVLGPEANTDHVNHFHVDMAPRRGHNFCE